MTDSTSLIEGLYNIVAMAGVVVIIYIMQTVESDRIGKIDPPVVMKLRRLAFTGTSLALCYSVIADWNRSLPVLLIVSCGVLNLTVNAVSLALRIPPGSGGMMHSSSYRRPYFISRLVDYFTPHR